MFHFSRLVHSGAYAQQKTYPVVWSVPGPWEPVAHVQSKFCVTIFEFIQPHEFVSNVQEDPGW